MGYADLPCSVDLNTYRKIPWENDLPFFLLDFTHPEKGKDLEVCPRVLLKKVNNNLQTELQLSAKIGPEFEWFNFKESPQSIKEKNYVNPEPLTPGMFGYSLQRAGQNLGYFQKILDYGQKFSVPIEGLHTETGPGVFEAAIEVYRINIHFDIIYLVSNLFSNLSFVSLLKLLIALFFSR